MKLRLTARGFETYNGQMGVIVFQNGLSVNEVCTIDALRVSGVIGAEWEDGTPVHQAQLYIEAQQAGSAVFEPARAEQSSVPATNSTPVIAPDVTYTEEDLAEIADEKGIAGLREIAEPLGIKGNSISGLIASILKVAGAKGA